MRVLGKVIGSGFGFFFGGPFGALLGAALGHQVMDNTPRDFQKIPMSDLEVKNSVFFVAVFSMFGKLALADEDLSEDEVEAVENLIHSQFDLSVQSEKFALETFHGAMDSDVSFLEYAEQFHEYFRGDPEILTATVEMLLTVAHADQHFHPKEEELIESAVELFGLTKNYHQIKALFSGDRESLEQCYQILGCSPSDELKTIKSSYRKLAMEFHPDRIQAKGLPDEFLNFASEKFKDIQRAYEIVLKEHK